MDMNQAYNQIVDEILILDCQSGRKKAIDLLVSRWQKRLWSHAYRMTNDADAAWEITQESWIGIIRGIRKLNDPAFFRAWAYKIVTNKIKDWIKKKNHNSRLIETETDIRTGSTENSSKPDHGDVSEILGMLPVDKRGILILYYFEQLSVSEIAKVLRVPNGTVKSRLHNARNELKKLWQKNVE
ncbi:MAG: RNA polymerase sigma factor [Planctomycetota bacterium]|jgi:RNA polymerase sigma-70 factor (ECF subfamily)